MNAQLVKGLWLLPALVALVLIVAAAVTTWGIPYTGAVWDANGRILGIEPDSPAEQAGLQVGDVVLAVNGHSPMRWDGRVRGAFQSGEEVTLTIQRGERSLSAVVTADMFPADYWATLPMFQLVALAFSVLSLVVLLGADTTEARLFYLMAQTWAADLAVGLFMTTGVPGMWTAWGILSALLAPVVIHFHSVFPERRWFARKRWPIALLYGVGLIVALSWIPSPISPPWDTTWIVTTILLGSGFIAAIGLMVAAYVTPRSFSARQRIRLVVLGTALGFGPFTLLTILTGQVSVRLTFPLVILVPVAYAIALWQHNLMGFDRALRRGIVYVLVSAVLVGAYFAALALFNTVLPADIAWRAVLGAASALAAAVTFRPLRDRIQRLVDRLFYGGWYDYRGLVEEVGQALARTLDQEMLADVLARRVPAAMHLPGAALLLERDGQLDVVSAQGVETAHEYRPPDGEVRLAPDRALVPLVVEGQVVGLWILAGRPVEGWGPEDEDILTALGQQAALAAQNVRLIAELRTKMAEVEEMHRRLLGAREEERADLARELHDGVIQDMVGLRYRLETLQKGEPEQVEALHTQVGLLIDELRRLCSDLRPPMLDQLGLAAALQALAREVTARGLPIEVQLEDVSLPDQVAIGLYRICQEALSNALRHAGASRAVVILSHSRHGKDKVVLTITDDGRGFDPAAGRGQAGRFGLLGMAERTEALGGHLEVDSAPGKGTRITVRTWPASSCQPTQAGDGNPPSRKPS